jgi:alpha-pyrone synthase
MTTAYLNRVATAVPENDVHESFVGFAGEMLQQERPRRLFARMAERAEIHNPLFQPRKNSPPASAPFSAR